jgi:integrase
VPYLGALLCLVFSLSDRVPLLSTMPATLIFALFLITTVVMLSLKYFRYPLPRSSKSHTILKVGFCEPDADLCIRGVAPYHIQVAATIGYYTGMRKGEIFSHQWEKHIDIEQHCIRLEPKQTKTNTSRGLYMSGDFLKVMLKAKEVRGREFSTCPWVVHLNGQR